VPLVAVFRFACGEPRDTLGLVFPIGECVPLSDPTVRRVHYAVAAVGLGLLLWGFWGQVHLARLPDLDPAPVYPVRFGGVDASSPAQVALLAQGYRPGAHVELV